MRLPHVRGGVSLSSWAVVIPIASSPRAWGCFFSAITGKPLPEVFPTCVGVFPTLRLPGPTSLGLPHVRGGVSLPELLLAGVYLSSPRAWGCFSLDGRLDGHSRGLPHVRGGVSHHHAYASGDAQSSPRAWGCFCPRLRSGSALWVFPTCVGVFLPALSLPQVVSRLPHVRGGVSKSLR